MRNLRCISAFVNKWKEDKHARLGITLAAVILSALVQVYASQVFVRSAGIISGGFIGIAILIGHLGDLWGLTVPMQMTILLMNIPVALMCCKGISVHLTMFSLAQVFLNSIFLRVFSFTPILTDEVLNVIFGGIIFGSAIVIALRGNASSGGADSITLFASSRTGQSIWSYVFFGNTIMYCFYGSIFRWEYTGYSIIPQLIPARMISAFHHRYELVALQIAVIKGPEVVETYINRFRHDMSCVEATGGYSRKKMCLLNTVISACEINDAVHMIQEADEHVIINVLKTQQFVRRFYRAPLK